MASRLSITSRRNPPASKFLAIAPGQEIEWRVVEVRVMFTRTVSEQSDRNRTKFAYPVPAPVPVPTGTYLFFASLRRESSKLSFFIPRDRSLVGNALKIQS